MTGDRKISSFSSKLLWWAGTLLFILSALFSVHFTVLAEEPGDSQEKVVRVGWYESPFHRTDQFGRRSGYAYEYQQKIAAYTGWKYEYVEGSWPELLDKLKNGEIDLLSDVSYTEERAKEILYSALPMGSESYYIFVKKDHSGIRSDDVSTLNGKKIGVDRGSLMKDLFLTWAQAHDVQAELQEYDATQEEAMQMLKSGELDAYVMLDAYGDPELLAPLWKVGSSDYYFALSQKSRDLLPALDMAMNKIHDENTYYNQQLYEKYLQNSGTGRYLDADELEWLKNHGTIRVGYQDNYLAFCAADEKTGELTGALKDYLGYASESLENAELTFEAIAYPTAAEALTALQNGEVDCMFPANLTDYDGEQMDLIMTTPLMKTEMDAVVRESDQKEFIKKKDVTVAVNKGNTNYEMFLMDHYPGWKIAYFEDTPAGLDGVAAGDADCVIISNYRFNNISKKCEKLHLTTVYTGVDMEYCFAVRKGQTQLYSILSKIASVVPESLINTSLLYYSTEDVKTGFLDFIMDHIVLILLVIIAAVSINLFLLHRSIRAEKKASEEHELVDDLNKKVFVDALTNVRNKGAFNECLKELQGRINKSKESYPVAIGMLDCDNLKKINDQYGHEKGDFYLKGASRLICHVFRHSPVFRIGGDEFAVVIENEDYRNMEGLIKSFYRRKRELCELAENEWDEVHISLGIAEYDPKQDNDINDTVRRADKIMYENKRVGKKHRNSKGSR